MQANNIPEVSLKEAKSPYNILGWGRPKFVAVTPVMTTEQKNNRTFIELETGVAPSMQPNLYVPLESQWTVINAKAYNLNNLYQNNSRMAVDKIISKYHTDIMWLPLKAYEQDMVVLIDDNKVVDIVDLRP